MTAPLTRHRLADGLTRRAVVQGGALTVGFAFAGMRTRARAATGDAGPRPVDPNEVDSFLAVNGDGTVTVYCGKVDLGQGLRIAMRQIAGEELGIGVDMIKYVEGDTALTPDQGRTSGSNGIQRGGMQLRRAAATARQALIELAAQRLNATPDDLVARDGEIKVKNGGAGIKFAELIGGRSFNLKLNPKAPLKDPATYTLVGKPLPRPDVPAKCTGGFTYMQDFSVPGMVHARVIRPPAIGAKLIGVDEASIKDLPGASVVRIKDFLAVIADDEWTAVRAARALRAQWSEWSGLPAQDKLIATLRADPQATDEMLVNRGQPGPSAASGAVSRSASYFWPMQSHGSIGPSCAVADVHSDAATVWTASQGTHGNRKTFARFLGLPEEKVRLIYLDGAGCYGMNGHEDAAADAAIISRAVGRPVACAMVAPGRARLGSQRSAAAARHFRRDRSDWTHPQLAHRDVAAANDAGFTGYSAARSRRRRDRRRARPPARIDLAECRSTLCGGQCAGAGALAQRCAAAAGANPLAGKAGQLLCRRELHRRTRGGGRARPDRIPAAWTNRSARHRGDQARGGADELADRVRPSEQTRLRRSCVAAALPMFTTSTARVMWRWEWRLRSSAAAAASKSNGLLARTTADRSSIPTGYARRSKAASCKRSAVC